MRRLQLTSRVREVKRRRALDEMKVGLFSCVALGPPARRCIVGEVRMNEGIRIRGAVLYFCKHRFPVSNRRSPDVEKNESLLRLR